ncbi:hypothetical protein EJB05_12083, partial [Eragrostis curvula]
MQGGRSRCPFLVLLLAAAVALPFFCDQRSGNYSSGSAYEDNISRLISDLHAKAASSPSFFAADFAGTGAGTVYGLMLCRGDVSASDCFDCGTFAGRDLQRVCNRTRDVALCYNQCYVRISDTDFLANATNSGLVKLIGGTSISSGVDVAAYDRAVTALLSATARHAAENNSTTRKFFATGQLVGLDPTIPTIWSSAQCASDLYPEQCRRCLDDLVAQWFRVFQTNEESARMVGARCNLRSQLGIKFYAGPPMVNLQMDGQPASPEPAPSVDVLPGTVRDAETELSLAKLQLPSPFVCGMCVRKEDAKEQTFLNKLLINNNRDGISPAHTAEDFESLKSTILSLSSLQVATDNFNESNKLGEGGFGAVYKDLVWSFNFMEDGKFIQGNLSGQAVAVKRLSKGSNQGLEELRNELVLVSKLHHKNLVWRHWSEGTILEIIDDSLGRNYWEAEVLKCINIGLLCLQQNPIDRPTMSDVMVMLNGDATSSLPPASRPTFFLDGSSASHPYAR